MADINDLAKLEVFCKNERCGDPVADRLGNVQYTKRRMNLVRTEKGWSNGVVYKCPICGRERRFLLEPWTNNISEG